jgi:hypothetical protein
MPMAPTDDERDEIRRQTLLRAVALVQRYQDENWRRLRVNDICTHIKRILHDEVSRYEGHTEKESGAPASGGAKTGEKFNAGV